MVEKPNGTVTNCNEAQIKSIKLTETKEIKMVEKPKRKYSIEPVFGVLNKAHNQFMRQVVKNNETKRECIKANIQKHYDDELRFWLDFNQKAGVLPDSIKFNEYCKSKGYIPKQVAEHTVFEGKKFYNAVIQGNYVLLDEMANMFNGYLFIDTENIYNKPTQSDGELVLAGE